MSQENLKPDLGLKDNKGLAGRRLVFEPGDATRYELLLVWNAANGKDITLVMLSPEKSVMRLPSYWGTGLNEHYVSEKLDVNTYTARVIIRMLESLAEGIVRPGSVPSGD